MQTVRQERVLPGWKYEKDKEQKKAHPATITSCITNLIVFFDRDEKIGQHHFIDVLKNKRSGQAKENAPLNRQYNIP